MTNIIDFDWEFYLIYNVDVSDCYGYYENGAIMHYDTYGSNENRIYSEAMFHKSYPFLKDFDSEFYKNNNSGLNNLTHYQLIQHYLFQGYAENKNVQFDSELFDYVDESDINKISENNKISVIMIIQNDSETMQYSIDSILKQTYENFEIIIIDDNSNLRTKSMLTQYIRNCRVIILENETKYGYFKSVNIALSMCSGNYITLHGASDISGPDRFMHLMSNVNSEHMLIGNMGFESHLHIHDIACKTFREIFLKSAVKNMINVVHNDKCCQLKIMFDTALYHISVFDSTTFEEMLSEKKFNINNECKFVDEILYIK